MTNFILKKLANNTFLHVLILAAVAVFTFLPTLEMFFYLDEWGNLYEFSHAPYKFYLFTSHVFYLLYTQFGLDATPYYAVGTLIYAISVILFYILVSSLLNNRLLGFVAGLIYATTPVGTDTVFMLWTFVMEGGYPLTVALLFLLVLLLKHIRERRVVYYLFVFVGFLLFLELEPRRVFLFLPILFLFDYLVSFKNVIPSLGFLVRQIFLVIAFIAYYKYDLSLSKVISTGNIILNVSASTYDWQTKFKLGIDSLTHFKPLITLTNILLGGPWVFASERLTGYVALDDIKQVYPLVAIAFSIVTAALVLSWKIKKEWGLMLLFSLLWMYTNILGIYVFSSPGVGVSTHRTLSLAAPGYALFITLLGASIYTLLKKRKKGLGKKLDKVFVLVLLVFLLVNFLATRHNFERFNSFRNRPARAFFNDLKHFYPTLPPNSLIYFETPANPQIKYQLSRIYGGNNYGAGATIATFYPERKMEEITVVREYEAVQKFVGSDSAKIERVFAFYWDENGLSDKTANIRSDLRK